MYGCEVVAKLAGTVDGNAESTYLSGLGTAGLAFDVLGYLASCAVGEDDASACCGKLTEELCCRASHASHVL